MTHTYPVRALIAPKLDMIISGYRINQDDADWLRGLLHRASATPSAPVGVAEAWQEGYRQGVLDERTSEDNIGIAGFGAKVEPARNNPYALAQQHGSRDHG